MMSPKSASWRHGGEIMNGCFRTLFFSRLDGIVKPYFQVIQIVPNFLVMGLRSRVLSSQSLGLPQDFPAMRRCFSLTPLVPTTDQ